MEILKLAALAFCAIVFIILVKNYKPEFGVLTALGCSLIILYYIIDSLRYSVAYLAELYDGLEYGKPYFPIMIKVLIIAYITEFTSQLCKDAGETSIASKIELGGKILIFCAAIPIFTSILNIVESIL